MIVFDGTYRLRPDADGSPEPIGRWLCAWRVRIINLTETQPTVRHLKPTIVIANPIGSASGLTSCAEGVGKKISRDFDLDVDQVLWIEQTPSKSVKWHTAVFRPRNSFGREVYYNIQWRPATPNEIDLIEPFVSKSDNPRSQPA
jgi:hypothetical protein